MTLQPQLGLGQAAMADKEGKSLLPTSSPPVTKAKVKGISIERAFFWLHILTTGLLVCWLTFLTVKSGQSDQKTSRLEEMVRQLMTTQQEVRGATILPPRLVVENFSPGS